MRRGKIEIKKIEDVHRLQVTFRSRCKGMMKKANELAVLCDVDVALIVFSNTGELQDFSSRSVEKILSRYGYSADHKQRDSSQENVDVFRKDESLRSKVERLQLAIERMKGKELEGMSYSDFTSLERKLNDSLLSVKDRKTILLNEVERSRLQEKRTLEENQLLSKQIESMLGRDSSGLEPESSSSDDHENDNDFDTSLRLGWGKRKKLKIKRPCHNSESQCLLIDGCQSFS